MIDNKYTKLPYRPCVGIMLIKNKKIFVGERIDYPGAWQMPQGGIDDDENISEAALRELKEEVGTDKATILRIAPHAIKYDLPIERIPTFWNGKYRGQEQIWVALTFTGEDSDINLDWYHEPEFSAWAWVDKKNALEKIVPFKKELYIRVFKLFDDLVD